MDWSAGDIELVTEPTGLAELNRPLRAGVSSFGISGTNAHVIIEQPPAKSVPVNRADGEDTELPVLPWLISGKSRDAVRAQASRLLSYVESNPDVRPADLAYSLATTRSAFVQRAAVVAADRDAVLRSLSALATDSADAAVLTGEAATSRVAMLFTGQGSQRAGMCRELYQRFGVFAEALDEVLAAFDGSFDRPLREVLFAEDGSPAAALLDGTGWAQPALFAVEVALYRMLRAYGVKPSHVGGHSIGEIVAAHVAGVLSLADACALVTARATLMAALPAGGAMIAVQAGEDEVAPLLTGGVSIAAINAPGSVVVSGVEDEVLALAARFADDGRKTKRLRVSHAFHSPLMDPMLDDFRRSSRTCRSRRRASRWCRT